MSLELQKTLSDGNVPLTIKFFFTNFIPTHDEPFSSYFITLCYQVSCTVLSFTHNVIDKNKSLLKSVHDPFSLLSHG